MTTEELMIRVALVLLGVIGAATLTMVAWVGRSVVKQMDSLQGEMAGFSRHTGVMETKMDNVVQSLGKIDATLVAEAAARTALAERVGEHSITLENHELRIRTLEAGAERRAPRRQK